VALDAMLPKFCAGIPYEDIPALAMLEIKSMEQIDIQRFLLTVHPRSVVGEFSLYQILPQGQWCTQLGNRIGWYSRNYSNKRRNYF